MQCIGDQVETCAACHVLSSRLLFVDHGVSAYLSHCRHTRECSLERNTAVWGSILCRQSAEGTTAIVSLLSSTIRGLTIDLIHAIPLRAGSKKRAALIQIYIRWNVSYIF